MSGVFEHSHLYLKKQRESQSNEFFSWDVVFGLLYMSKNVTKYHKSCHIIISPGCRRTEEEYRYKGQEAVGKSRQQFGTQVQRAVKQLNFYQFLTSTFWYDPHVTSAEADASDTSHSEWQKRCSEQAEYKRLSKSAYFSNLSVWTQSHSQLHLNHVSQHTFTLTVKPGYLRQH